MVLFNSLEVRNYLAIRRNCPSAAEMFRFLSCLSHPQKSSTDAHVKNKMELHVVWFARNSRKRAQSQIIVGKNRNRIRTHSICHHCSP